MATVTQSLTVMEAGFKIRPGKEQEFLAAQNKMIPVGMSQPGFVSVYGGPIMGSSWLYFGVRFATQEQMDAWYRDPRHRAVQEPARRIWWTAVYIRKWRLPVAGDAFGDRVFCETRIARDAPLDATDQRAIQSALARLTAHNPAPFETLTGEFETQPYQLVGPLEIAPSFAPVGYSFLTHWRSHEDALNWQSSADYKALSALGSVSTEAFIPVQESSERLGLREDRLQRDWTLRAS
jgi:heme-degrading monooxygenase HmoA